MIKINKKAIYIKLFGLFGFSYVKFNRNVFREFYIDNWLKSDRTLYLGLYYLEVKLKQN